MSMSLSEIQKMVDEWINQFEEGYWPPLSMFANVVEEVGELGREINNLEGYKKKRGKERTKVGLELADIIFSIVCIANYYEIDLEKAFLDTMKKYANRDTNRWTKKKLM